MNDFLYMILLRLNTLTLSGLVLGLFVGCASGNISRSQANAFSAIYYTHYSSLKPKDREAARAAVNVFLNQQLSSFAQQIRQADCPITVHVQHIAKFTRQEDIDCGNSFKRERAFYYPYKTSSHIRSDSEWRTISKKEQVQAFWPGNFPLLLEEIRRRYQPIAEKSFENYDPYTFNVLSGNARHETIDFSTKVEGTEFLLRDGRTLLSVKRISKKSNRMCRYDSCWDGDSYANNINFALLDVRRVPPKASYRRSEEMRYDDVKLKSFEAEFDPKYHKFLREWGGAADARPISADLLIPQIESQINIDPQLTRLGEALAKVRWQRLDYLLKGFVNNAYAAQNAANRTELTRHNKAQQRWNANNAQAAASMGMTNGGNPIVAGIIAGAQSASQDMAYWNARAAQAQATLWRTANGCSAVSCSSSSDQHHPSDANNGHRKHASNTDGENATSKTLTEDHNKNPNTSSSNSSQKTVSNASSNASDRDNSEANSNGQNGNDVYSGGITLRSEKLGSSDEEKLKKQKDRESQDRLGKQLENLRKQCANKNNGHTCRLFANAIVGPTYVGDGFNHIQRKEAQNHYEYVNKNHHADVSCDKREGFVVEKLDAKADSPFCTVLKDGDFRLAYCKVDISWHCTYKEPNCPPGSQSCSR